MRQWCRPAFFFLLSVLLLIAWPADALRTLAVPEICGDGLDQNLNGTVDDGCPQTDAFASCTGGYCAEFEAGILASELMTLTDSNAANGSAVRIPIGKRYADGQVKMCGSFTAGTYYLWLRALTPSSQATVAWVSLDSAHSYVPTNAKGALLFAGQAQTTYAWTQVNSFDSGANFLTRTVGTSQKTFALDGVGCFYLTALPDVRLDAAFLSTNVNAVPTTGGGGAVVNYEVLEVGANAITVDGSCGEDAWSNAGKVSFTGFNNGTTNTVTWKMLWDDAATDKLYGCVTVTDTDLRATTTANDNGGIFSDDSIEFIHRTNLTRIFDSTTFKTVLNIASTPAHLDRNYPNGSADNTYTSNLTKAVVRTGTLDSTANDTSYVIEWGQDLGFNAVGDQLGRCAFRLTDRDATQTRREAFSTDGNIDNSDQWGVCKFSATTVPAPPADTTNPTVSSCTAINVGNVSGDVRCTVTDNVSTSFSAKLRYGTTISGPYPNTSGSVTCTTPCTVSLSGLVEGTAYFALMDATDAGGNTGTSSETTFTTTSANNVYIATTGNDANAGTSALPWKTWAKALKALTAGKTLIVKDGTYDAANGAGFPNVNCSSGYVSGTASQPITVRAENERQAAILNNGSAAGTTFVLENCAYWVIQGLRLENADFNNGTIDSGHVLFIGNSNNLTIKRNLLRKNNRYRNSHLIYGVTVSNSLFEENELYEFHRHGIQLGGAWNTPSVGNTVRRNYVNSRVYADLPGSSTTAPPYKSVQNPGGDYAVGMYPATNTVVENNIAENTYTGVTIHTSGNAANRLYGNIVVNTGFGMLVTPKGGDPDSSLTDGNTAVNQLAVRVGTSSFNGPRVQSQNAKNTRCDNCTVINSSVGAFSVAEDTSSGIPLCGGQCSYFSENSLALNNGGTGFFVASSQMVDWLLDYPASFGNVTAFSPSAADSHITNEVTSNPSLGSCKVLIPNVSPLKGAGKNGADIGATVLYKYVNGILGTVPLWNAADSYKFTGCGAVITGVNSDTNNSCTGVQVRLNVGTANGCALPY